MKTSAAALALLALGPLLSASSHATESPLPDLSTLRWRHRVLVIDAPSPADPAHRAQSAALAEAWAGLLERDVQVLTRAGAGVSTFRIRLVGKDGGVKLDSAQPVGVAGLFALIDAMPMRREEAAAGK